MKTMIKLLLVLTVGAYLGFCLVDGLEQEAAIRQKASAPYIEALKQKELRNAQGQLLR